METDFFRVKTCALVMAAVVLELGAADWSIATSGTQAVTEDATYGAIAVDAPNVTLAVDAGTTVSATAMTVKSTAGASSFTLSGGGTLSLTDSPFNVGDSRNPVSVTVSGAGTTLLMPKTASSGLYIGPVEEGFASVEHSLHVTAGASVVISNATCVGTGWKDGVVHYGKGRLLVDDGAYLYGGAIFYAGRSQTASLTAVTNATLEAGILTSGDGGSHRFLASNATIRATQYFTFPETAKGRFHQLAFTDSTLCAPTFYFNHAGWGNTGRLDRCTVNADYIYANDGGAWHNDFTLADCNLTATGISVGYTISSNSVLRFVRTPLNLSWMGVGAKESEATLVRVEDSAVTIGTLAVGFQDNIDYSHRPRYEQVGGSLAAATELNVGKYVCDGASAELRGLSSFSTGKIICGDSAKAIGPRLVMADIPANATSGRLWVGAGASGARVLLTNTVLSVTYPGVDGNVNWTCVGISGTAFDNELEIVDGTLNQTGGHFYVGYAAGASNNVLRLVRATIDYTTTGGKGDLIVGTDGAGCRIDMTASTIRYNRRWMAVGQNANAKNCAWELADGSSLAASGSQLQIGYRATGCRFALKGTSSADVSLFALNNGATFEVAGAGNRLQVGSEGYSVANGCAFRFTPPATASETPMLTMNKNLDFTSARKLTVDFSGAGYGTHVLVSSFVAQNEPVKGENVELVNVGANDSARVWRSADGTKLLCSLAPKGLTIIIR